MQIWTDSATLNEISKCYNGNKSVRKATKSKCMLIWSKYQTRRLNDIIQVSLNNVDIDFDENLKIIY